ncbi:hypothetical protein, partial [Candidatus Phytoplasma fabacearum]
MFKKSLEIQETFFSLLWRFLRLYYGLLCNSIAQHYNEKIISCYDLLDSVDRSFVELSKFLNIDL